MALEEIKTVTGRGVPIPGDDIDTDRIIPARYMKCVTFDELGEFLFYDARRSGDGEFNQHPLNDPRFRGATIMLAGNNFGCGSSREHAPQAIYRNGFRGIIAESFAEIFFGNSTTLGMPCVTLDHAHLRQLSQLVDADPQTQITIDVENRQVRCAGHSYPAEMPESARAALISGHWDPIADLLEGDAAITERVNQLAYLSAA